MSRNITRKCNTRPPGGPKRKRATSHRLEDTGTAGGSGTASAEVNPVPASFQVRSDSVFDEDSMSNQFSALHVLEMLVAKMEDAALPRQSRALETLLRQERMALTVQATWHKLREDQGRALGMCLDDCKNYPEIADMFRHAFAALKKAQPES